MFLSRPLARLWVAPVETSLRGEVGVAGSPSAVPAPAPRQWPWDRGLQPGPPAEAMVLRGDILQRSRRFGDIALPVSAVEDMAKQNMMWWCFLGR